MGSRPTTVQVGRSTAMDRAAKPRTVQGASFFKVLFVDFAQKMRIPRAFIKHFNGKVPYESILRSPTGRVWHAKVEKVGDDLFFQNGWPDFVEENFLQLGDILVFKYQGNSQFDVKMFDKTGCEKEEASVEKNDECGSYTEVKEEQSKEIVLVKSTNTCQCSLSQIKRKMQSSDACPYKIRHPHYTVPWTRKMLYKMPVPKTFVDASGMRMKTSILLHDPEGKQWPVKVVPGKDRITLGSGWAAIVYSHGVKEGSVCGLECIPGRGRGKRRVLKVHIFHDSR